MRRKNDLPGLSPPWEPSVRDTLTCSLFPVVILGLNSLKILRLNSLKILGLNSLKLNFVNTLT